MVTGQYDRASLSAVMSGVIMVFVYSSALSKEMGSREKYIRKKPSAFTFGYILLFFNGLSSEGYHSEPSPSLHFLMKTY